MKTYTIQIQFDEREGEYYIPLPDEMLKALADLGWSVNDDLEWICLLYTSDAADE